MPQLQCLSEFHLNLKTPARFGQSCFGHYESTPNCPPSCKAIAQTEPEGNKIKPVGKLLKSNNFSQYERNSKFTSSGKDRDCTK